MLLTFKVGRPKVIAKLKRFTRNTVLEARSVVRALEGEIGDFSSNHAIIAKFPRCVNSPEGRTSCGA